MWQLKLNLGLTEQFIKLYAKVFPPLKQVLNPSDSILRKSDIT